MVHVVCQVPALHADVPSRRRLPATGADRGEPLGEIADIRWSDRKTSNQQRGDGQQKENTEETENGIRPSKATYQTFNNFRLVNSQMK